MRDLLGNFINATTDLNQGLLQLIDLGLEKQQLIIFNQVKELDALIRKEGNLVNQLTSLEMARYKLQESLAAYFKISPQDLTAASLLAKVEAEYGDFYGVLKEQIDELSYLLTRLKSINTHNNELIEQSLDYIDTMQSLLSGDLAGTYSEQGEETTADSRPRVGLLDRKV